MVAAVSTSAGGGTITLLAGAVLLRLTLTGTYQRYVKVGMGPWLTIAGVALVALGLATLARSFRRPAASHDEHSPDDEHRPDGAHDHDHSDNVGWLLLAPIAALLLVAPPTLGSYGVDRGAAVDVTAGAPAFDDLEAGGAPVRMTLLEYSQRAFDHDGETFAGASVQLTGFVVDGGGGEGFRLARYQIACCAVDAAPVVVRVVGTTGDIPRRDQWVTVTGSYEATQDAGDDEVPALSATTVLAIEPPEDPYE
jgi:uncharacterized repeat protein (TIGR03943 family)